MMNQASIEHPASHPLISRYKIHYLLFAYFACTLLLSPFGIYQLDTYYYWDWSRHIALSYYDGSPMIAYLIRLSTLLLGNSNFALGMVAVTSTALTSWVVFKAARLYLSQEASYVALLLWLFSPLTTLDILHQVTYDTPQALFWASTIYFILSYLKYQRPSTLYGIGVSAGLLMLSKYTGVILLLAMFIFLIVTPHRRLFKSIHFYLACLIIAIISSPVLIWNYQHQWISFVYQMNIHKVEQTINPIANAGRAILKYFIPSLNALLITPFYCLFGRYHRRSPMVAFCLTVSLVFLAFVIMIAAKSDVRANWLAPYLISTGLLAGYCYQQKILQKATKLLIAVYILMSFAIIVHNNPNLYVTGSNKIAYYYLVKQFNQDHPNLSDPIFTSTWSQARPYYFLKGKPQVYTLPCTGLENQYGLWSQQIVKQIRNKEVKRVLYIDLMDTSYCALKYFDKCSRIPTRSYSRGHKKHEIYAYRCINNA